MPFGTPLLRRKALLLGKIETTYGTDSLPAAANAVVVSNLEIVPIAAEYAERSLIRPWLGISEQMPTKIHVEVNFDVELAGAGAAGTAPKWGPFVRACAMSETVNAGADVTYLPISSAFESVSLAYNVDGLQHKVVGARGTWDIALDANNIPHLKFKMWGLYAPPTDTGAVTPDYTGWQKPVVALTANTTPISFHGVTPMIQSFSASLGNNVIHRSLLGGESILITDRKPTGQIVMEQSKVADKDWWTLVKNATTAAMSLQHGITAGNIVVVSAPAVQMTNPRKSDSDGIDMLTFDLNFLPSAAAGNDDIKIVVK